MLEEHIAEATIEIGRKDISPDELHTLKRNLLDSYAGICASLADSDMLDTFKNYVESVPDPRGIVVWGTGRSAQAMQAVFMNSILGRRSDLVNTYLSPGHMGGNHPSDNVSLLLTLADWKKQSGKDLVRAMYVAYTLSCAFSDYYNPEAAGFDHDAQALFYTALIAGYLEGLDINGLVETQRIAGAMGLDIDQAGLGPVTDWKHCTYASCAMRGLSAALMAKAGFKGPVDIYEGAAGINRFLPHADVFMPKQPALESIVFKQWQALVFCQTAIDVAVKMHPQFNRHGLDRVETVIVETYQKALEEAGGEGCYHPLSRAGRTHSLPYCVAAALLHGTIGYDSFSDRMADDESMTHLIKKIQLRADELMTSEFPEKAPCRVTIKYKDLDAETAFREYSRGDPHDPLSDEEIADKATAYLTGLVDGEKAKSIIDGIWNIEKQTDLAWLIEPLYQGVRHA